MSILIDKSTRLIVQGITGRQGSFHARRIKQDGTNIVAGVVPGKGGQDFEGIEIYNTVLEAKLAKDANASIIFIPPKFSSSAILEAIDAGIAASCTGAINHVVQHYQENTGSNLQCVVTGGDAQKLLPQLYQDNPGVVIQYEPDWVLKGLAIISDRMGTEAIIDDREYLK